MGGGEIALKGGEGESGANECVLFVTIGHVQKWKRDVQVLSTIGFVHHTYFFGSSPRGFSGSIEEASGV